MNAKPGIKATAAGISIISNLSLVILKLIVGFITSSVSVLSEAAHSGIDLVASGIAYFSVKRADLPADQRHAYGHGKFENLSGAVEALLIFVAALFIIHEAVGKLHSKEPIQSLGLGIWVMALSAVTNLVISLYLLRVAKATDSMALEADAHHLLTDVYTSAGVMLGLLLIRQTGIVLLDPLFALGVALLITKTAYSLTRKSLGPLMDAKLPDEEEELIASIIHDHSSQFVEFHNLRTRKAGSQRHIDLHLVVKGDAHVEEAHRTCDHLEAEIRAALPQSMITIHIEPDSVSRMEAQERKDAGASETNGKPIEEHQDPPS
jgi:cation diffusion facilitator family transporter